MLAALITGFYLGAKQAKADGVTTNPPSTWGNLKCQYLDRCKNPVPVEEPDNKNQG